MRSAKQAAREYIDTKLGDRSGFRHLLGEINEQDPLTYREIVKELAEEFDRFVKERRVSPNADKPLADYNKLRRLNTRHKFVADTFMAAYNKSVCVVCGRLQSARHHVS